MNAWMATVVVTAAVMHAAAGQVVKIEPREPVLRDGQVVQLMCKADQPVMGCSWLFNKQPVRPNSSSGRQFTTLGRWSHGECGILARMSEEFHGEWLCRLMVQGSAEQRALTAATNVTHLVLPEISMLPEAVAVAHAITVVAGKETEVSCTVANARPGPSVLWMISDRTIASEDVRDGDQGMVTIAKTLSYTFRASDHGQMIRCMTSAPWLRDGDPREASARLNVLYPAQPRLPVTTKAVVGAPVDVVLSFTANPRPLRVFWSLDDGQRLDVVPFAARSPAHHDRYEVVQMKETDTNWYETRLRVRTVTPSDAGRVFRLTVESDVGGVASRQDFTARVDAESPASPDCPSSSSSSSSAAAAAAAAAAAVASASAASCGPCRRHLTDLRIELEKNRDGLDFLVEQIAALEDLFQSDTDGRQ